MKGMSISVRTRSGMSAALVVVAISLLLHLLAGCGGGGGGAEPGPSISPSLARWQADMLQYGTHFCDEQAIISQETWEGGVWYYDGARVFYQLADFTRDDKWQRCAEYVLGVYKPYVLQSNGAVPGWRVFPHGLYQHYRRTGDSSSRDAVLLLARNSAFARQAGGADPELSRETAYLIHSYLFAAACGASEFEPLLRQAVNYAIGHLNAWADGGSPSVKPFMAALTMEALIHYADTRSDARVLPAVSRASDWLWRNTWHDNSGSFRYILCRDGSGSAECAANPNTDAPDLNLLIAPAYAWIFFISGDEEAALRADKIFDGGVRSANLDSGKRFSQNYRWSFDYLRWREGILTSSGL